MPMQLLACAKLPPAVILEIDSGALPTLTKVIDAAGLDVPTLCGAKSNAGAEKLIVGADHHTESVCGDTPIVLAALNCTRSQLPSAFR
jgi:hypothetical protein